MSILRSLCRQLASSTRTCRSSAVCQAELRGNDACQAWSDSMRIQAGRLHGFANAGPAEQQKPLLPGSRQQASGIATSPAATAEEPGAAGGVERPPRLPPSAASTSGTQQTGPSPGYQQTGPSSGYQQSPHRAVLQARLGPKIGTVYVQSTKNNTICTLVDTGGMPVAWASAGSCGFKNARKSTPYAAQATAERIATKSMDKGWHNVRVVMKGLGFGKQSAVRALIKTGLNVVEIHEHTPLPHNGCRPPKRRRV